MVKESFQPWKATAPPVNVPWTQLRVQGGKAFCSTLAMRLEELWLRDEPERHTTSTSKITYPTQQDAKAQGRLPRPDGKVISRLAKSSSVLSPFLGDI